MLTVFRASAGTGKTFTLSAYYIALLMSGRSYRNILAVTFTNKATAEMRTRILRYLFLMAEHWDNKDLEGFIPKVREFVHQFGCVLPNFNPDNDADMQRRAAQLYREMLVDFDGMRVTTIDAFLLLLFSGVVRSLYQSMGYEVDLDTDHAIHEAVDQLMTTHLDTTPGLAALLTRHIEERMDDERGWDLRDDLCQLATQLFRESVLSDMKSVCMDGTIIDAFRQEYTAACDAREAALCAELNTAARALGNMPDKAFPRAGEKPFNAFITACCTLALKADMPALSADGKSKADARMASWEMFEADYQLGDARFWFDRLTTLNTLCEQIRQVRLIRTFTPQNLADMTLLGFLRDRIRGNCAERNAVLLSEVASKLSQALAKGDADFILEKAGLRYNYILLDEFQDTSTLQWQNFLLLIEEILANNNNVLIVGDIKQSIYRWRNGDWHIMDNLQRQLGHFPYEEITTSINRRSCQEVVRFNLDTMCRVREDFHAHIYDEQYTPETLTNFYVKGKHDGGYVRWRAYPCSSGRKDSGAKPREAQAKEWLLHDMFAQIHRVLEAGIEPKDCMILIRNNYEAKDILAALEQVRHEDELPRLRDLQLVSNDSFLLENSTLVKVVVNALKVVFLRDKVAEEYVRLNAPMSDAVEHLQEITPHLPLYDLTEKVMRYCLGTGDVAEADYLNCFRDKLREYIRRYGADGKAFLRHWDDKMRKEAIPAPSVDAVRMMTVHSSKGLEAKCVFIPFCQWPMQRGDDNKNKSGMMWVTPAGPDAKPNWRTADPAHQLNKLPVSLSKNMVDAGYEKEFCEEMSEQHTDNLNLLYVALTRAACNLFIWNILRLDEDPAKQLQADYEGLNVGYKMLCGHGFFGALCQVMNDATNAEDECFLEHEYGSLTCSPNPPDELDPFSFKRTVPAEPAFICGDNEITFQQSGPALKYFANGDEEQPDSEAIDYRQFGVLCHEIMEAIEVQADMQPVIKRFYAEGRIRNQAELDKVQQVMAQIWTSPLMCDWFSGNWRLLREQTIARRVGNEIKERRLDRVMVRGEQAIVLDYKFGYAHEDDHYHDPQVQDYMAMLREVGYRDVKGYLWMAQTAHLLEVKEDVNQ